MIILRDNQKHRNSSLAYLCNTWELQQGSESVSVQAQNNWSPQQAKNLFTRITSFFSMLMLLNAYLKSNSPRFPITLTQPLINAFGNTFTSERISPDLKCKCVCFYHLSFSACIYTRKWEQQTNQCEARFLIAIPWLTNPVSCHFILKTNLNWGQSSNKSCLAVVC